VVLSTLLTESVSTGRVYMRLLAAAAWLGGAALFAGPMSSMKQAKIDHTAFARFEGERLSGFESYDVYEFSEHKP
jgi:hypothetical protein